VQVRKISKEQHLAFIATQPSVSFLQTPAWGEVKREWRSESIGWFNEENTLVGCGLVLYRQLPKLNRFLAYLPEGPGLDWTSSQVAAQLTAMVRYLKSQGAFAVRIGPPVRTSRWNAESVKSGLADQEIRQLTEVEPTEQFPIGVELATLLGSQGWKSLSTEGGFAIGQPQYNFQIPLQHADGSTKSEAELLAGMNQLWRRNIKRATKLGVTVRVSTPPTSQADLAAFHTLYVETAQRDRFTPRPLSYFLLMSKAMTAESPERFKLYLAEHEGDLVAATIGVCVGTHYWYSYGASSTAKRDVRGSNAIQWRMIQDAIANNCATYDMRGITNTLAHDDPHVGLINFKVGTGGEAVAYLGEWDLPLNKVLYAAFDLYLKRR
jgi:lipid II:glycine glycyltransferase (peptidoglycan interpeptide bridge formation enzyme)